MSYEVFDPTHAIYYGYGMSVHKGANPTSYIRTRSRIIQHHVVASILARYILNRRSLNRKNLLHSICLALLELHLYLLEHLSLGQQKNHQFLLILLRSEPKKLEFHQAGSQARYTCQLLLVIGERMAC